MKISLAFVIEYEDGSDEYIPFGPTKSFTFKNDENTRSHLLRFITDYLSPPICTWALGAINDWRMSSPTKYMVVTQAMGPIRSVPDTVFGPFDSNQSALDQIRNLPEIPRYQHFVLPLTEVS